MSITTVQNTTGCYCSTLYSSAVDGANWLSRNVKTAGVVVWGGAQKVATFATAVLAQVGQFIQQSFQTLQGASIQGFNAAKAFAVVHPMEIKLAVAALVGSAVTYVLCRACSKSSAPTNVNPPSTPSTTATPESVPGPVAQN